MYVLHGWRREQDICSLTLLMKDFMSEVARLMEIWWCGETPGNLFVLYALGTFIDQFICLSFERENKTGRRNNF